MDQLTPNRPDQDDLFPCPPADLVFDRVEVVIRLEMQDFGFHSPLFNHKLAKRTSLSSAEVLFAGKLYLVCVLGVGLKIHVLQVYKL